MFINYKYVSTILEYFERIFGKEKEKKVRFLLDHNDLTLFPPPPSILPSSVYICLQETVNINFNGHSEIFPLNIYLNLVLHKTLSSSKAS